MSYGEWSYENLLSDNEMYRRRIATLEEKVAIVDKLFANEIDPNIQIALVRREQWFPAATDEGGGE